MADELKLLEAEFKHLDDGIKQLENDIKQLENQILPMRLRRKAVADKMAELKSPFKIGDRVLMRENVYQIAKISSWASDGLPRYYGKKVLKSGELGKVEHELYRSLTKAD